MGVAMKDAGESRVSARKSLRSGVRGPAPAGIAAGDPAGLVLRAPWLESRSPCIDKLDRLGWPYGRSFVAYGVRIGLRSNDPDTLGRMAALLPPGAKDSPAESVELLYSLRNAERVRPARRGMRSFNLIYGNITRLARSMDIADALHAYESDLHLAVAERARRRLFVHAGVVGWRGRAILLPGRTRAGKSTLVAELVRAGATYYSDEFAVLDARGRVHPYAAPLSMRDAEEERPTRVAPEELGGRPGRAPLEVGLVALCEHVPGAAWRPRRLTAGRGTLALLQHTVAARPAPAKALAVLQTLSTRAVIVRSARGEAAEVSRRLLDLLESV